jgi:hypothetical protein
MSIPDVMVPKGRTALVYLARGADDDSIKHFTRFVEAYRSCPAGLAHDLTVVFKGFTSERSLEEGLSVFQTLPINPIHTDDLKFDIGAFADAVQQIESDRVCFLNTNAEPVSPDWLLKLALNLEQPGIGLAGATGSFESGPTRIPFPNIHVRTNAFMMRTDHARKILGAARINTKFDAYEVEHGYNSITRQISSLGFASVVVGRNGRGYRPEWWSSSGTFRQGDQSNILVKDNQTRNFANATWDEKKVLYAATWGSARTPGSPFMYATP